MEISHNPNRNLEDGCLGSLLTPIIYLEFIMPALCWIAPEIPQAT